ncbi:MAG: enoyl-CoA hydratase/isomerase family protein [Pseudomonadales bacterium]|nr:enoyl-CoA hydratase/isomerase family protein [Halioglobus sp.]MCP5128192.1 enoyl-CoA hydratase/isomerase family protein [Pseudomonadales bacterium]
MSAAPILFEELSCGDRVLMRVTLNVPATLNSLTLEMVDQLQAKLDLWRNDESVAAIFLEGSGEKAFCAGGDVQALYDSVLATPGGPCEYAENFFQREYRLDYTLHTYAKPIICWGHGIVMGGGLGVMAGCSHRVVTERTRFAMPEVNIALFPDVGGSWFLNHMPGKAGQFLALTGASINAADAIYTGIADRFISSELKEEVVDQLRRQEWSAVAATNHALVRHCLRPLTEQSVGKCPGGQVEPHLGSIATLCDGDDVHEIIQNILSQQTQDPWLASARDSLATASPLALMWTYRQLTETRLCSLREVFLAELVLATNIMRYPEFAEGVRALLIDKDRKPAWRYKSTRDVPPDVLDSFFTAPWERHPLADL